MQVSREHGLRALDIARENPPGETIMRRDEILATVEGSHHHPAVAVSLIVKVRVRGQKPL
jgi:hypothetical protein